MMGVPEDPGLIPNFCKKVFDYLQETAIGEEAINMKVTVSYLEIYNEKVRDLLNPVSLSKKTCLKIREHPKKGPYVQGLSEHSVNTTSDLLYWLEQGNKHRKIAATHSNLQSSRSHSVFVVNCDGVKLNLIDLAGSERAANRCFNISRFKEGSNINKSIVALGNVISALAEQTSKQTKGLRRRFVPYRDSILTWFLKDILGGNSNTVMVATVSPSSACYNETVNTLRFGQRAKNIIFRPVVNEDPKEKTIRDLRAEIFRLKELLKNIQLSGLNQMYFQKDIAKDPNKNATEITQFNHTNRLVTIFTHKLNAVEKPLHTNEEELIPVIDVEANVEKIQPDEKTYIMDPDKCGSDDSTLSSKSITSNQSSEQGSGSQTSRRSSLRTESLHKSVSSLSRASSKRQSLRAMSSENLSKRSETKLSLNSKISPRSQVVAAVTSRLYPKVKKKEAATDTDDINTYNLSVFPKELLISENARARLRNITRRALRANRIKNQDIQTDLVPVKRMKEISTNTSDLKIVLEELKHVGTMTATVESRDACVDSSDLYEPADIDANKNLLVTRSCGTQFNKEDAQRKQIATKPSTLISFTKYLKTAKDDMSTDAIYTNVVNINISNNYLQGDKANHSVSSDSLDYFESQSAYMVTPDLLSNHPALETSCKEVQTWYHGSIGELQDEFQESADYATEDCMKVYNKAKCSLIPNHSIAVPSIKMLKTHVAETFSSAPQEDEYCTPFKDFEVPLVKPNIVHSHALEHDDTVIVREPPILHQDIKNNQPEIREKKDAVINPKITKHFLQHQNHDAQRMVSAMSAFLEEATGIMSKLSGKVEENHSYDLQITVSGLKAIKHLSRQKKSSRTTETNQITEKNIKQVDQHVDTNLKCFKCFREKGSQTILPITYNCSTQSEEPTPQPLYNKYETPFEAACSRLERSLTLAPSPIRNCEPITEDLAETNRLDVDSEAMPYFSDYGSLPKSPKKKYRTWSLTPRSYLKQLTAMRKDIVESSRDYMKSFGDHVKNNHRAQYKYPEDTLPKNDNSGDHVDN